MCVRGNTLGTEGQGNSRSRMMMMMMIVIVKSNMTGWGVGGEDFYLNCLNSRSGAPTPLKGIISGSSWMKRKRR